MSLTKKRFCLILAALFLILTALLVSYLYINAKRTALTAISERATSFVGQRVEIADISFSLRAGINLHNITIKNQDGFQAGDLLMIKRLSFYVKFSELVKGIFYFKEIRVHSPELTLIKDKSGNFNISERLKDFLKKEPAISYIIDELNISSGIFSFYGERTFKIKDINFRLNNLSSANGSRTLLKGKLSPDGIKGIAIEGWIYLKDRSKKFSLSASSKAADISSLKASFRDFFKKYGVDTSRSKVDVTLKAEGDSEKGVNITSEVLLKKTAFPFLIKDIKNVTLNATAFYNIQDDSLHVSDMLLQADNISKLQLNGIITNLRKKPSYSAALKIHSLDLSMLKISKNLQMSGIVISDNMSISGTADETAPRISGTSELRNGSVISKGIDARNINSRLQFASFREMEAVLEASSQIFKAGDLSPANPVDLKFSASIKRRHEKITFASTGSFSPIEIKARDTLATHIKDGHFNVEGSFDKGVISAKSLFLTEGIKYGSYALSAIKGSLNLHYEKNTLIVKETDIKAENFKASADMIKIAVPEEKQGYGVIITNLSASYPEKKGELKSLDMALNLYPDKKISGDIVFSAKEVNFKDIRTGQTHGEGRLRENQFSIQIPQAEVFGGRLKLSLNGRTPKDPFPLTLQVNAENIDLGIASAAASGFLDIPFEITGNLKAINFDGVLSSAEVINGNAFVKAGKITLYKSGGKENILKDISLTGDLAFRGKNLGFKTDLKAGNISANISGSSKEFLKKERELTLNLGLPLAALTDIRNSLWEIFPDRLLYAGLDGSLSSQAVVNFNPERLKVSGSLTLKDISINGEYNEYSVKQINGKIPFEYDSAAKDYEFIQMPSFERQEFEKLKKYYTVEAKDDYSRITIGSVKYGFRLLEDIHLWIKQRGKSLNIGRVSANIFGGRLNGSGVVDISNGISYRAGMILHGISLTNACEEIEPIRGYMAGNVDGIAYLRGSQKGLSDLISGLISGLTGKIDLWTYSDAREKTKISGEFIQKIGGAAVKAYIGDRGFNKGVMSAYLKDGYIIFKALEISNKNILGITDLSIKVAPFHNRISIDTLMWSITEAAERAKKQ